MLQEPTNKVVPPTATTGIGQPASSLIRRSPILDSPVDGAPSAITTKAEQQVSPYLNIATSEPINEKNDTPAMSVIKDSLASLKEATSLSRRISYIPPVAGLLLQVLTMQDEVKNYKEKWGVMKDKLEKVASLVSSVGKACEDNNLEEDDLPLDLRTIFQTLETELGRIKRALSQSNEAGVIKKLFLRMCLGERVKEYDGRISNVLQAFQVALAFSVHFAQFAERLDVETSDVNARYSEDQTALHAASQLGHVSVMQSLIVRGANPNAENEDQETPLFMVSRNGNEEATRLLLRRHADVNHRDMVGRTPLHEASENGHSSVSRLLLKSRANSNARNAYDWTPLHLASRTGKGTVAEVLLRFGADINACNDLGWTPLHMASQQGHAEVVELLLIHHAKVDTQEADGETPLHLAAYYGHVGVAELLLNRGADKGILNKERETALELARKEGHRDVAQIIQAGAGIR